MKTSKTLLLLSVLLLFVAALMGGAKYQQKTSKSDFDAEKYMKAVKQLDFKITVDKQQWKVDDWVIIRAVTTNKGSEAIKIPDCSPWAVDYIFVTNEQGQPAQLSANMDNRNLINAANNSYLSCKAAYIEPGKIHESGVSLNRYYDLKKPGIYKVWLKHDFGATEETRHALTSNTITIEIVQ